MYGTNYSTVRSIVYSTYSIEYTIVTSKSNTVTIYHVKLVIALTTLQTIMFFFNLVVYSADVHHV